MTTRMRVLAAATLSVCTGGCAIKQNTAAIGGSTSAIASNTKAIQESTAGTTLLVPALQGVERLRGPMESVAALDPTLKGVAALRDPMGSVAALDPSMRSLAALGTSWWRFDRAWRPPRRWARRWIVSRRCVQAWKR